MREIAKYAVVSVVVLVLVMLCGIALVQKNEISTLNRVLVLQEVENEVLRLKLNRMNQRYMKDQGFKEDVSTREIHLNIVDQALQTLREGGQPSEDLNYLFAHLRRARGEGVSRKEIVRRLEYLRKLQKEDRNSAYFFYVKSGLIEDEIEKY